MVSVCSPGASFLYVVLSLSETVTTEPASVLMVNCFAAASTLFISPIACLAAIPGSEVWAIEAGIEASSVISPIAAAKKNFLMNLSFLSC